MPVMFPTETVHNKTQTQLQYVKSSLSPYIEAVNRTLPTLVTDMLPLKKCFTGAQWGFLENSQMTVWDPQHGEAQAQIRLPIVMETLNSIPDMTPLVNRYNDVMEAMPDRDSVQYFYDNVSGVIEMSMFCYHCTVATMKVMSFDIYTLVCFFNLIFSIH